MAVDGQRLVVLRALGLGDLLTAVPALRGLARAFPTHARLLAAPAALADVVALAGAGFDVVDVDLRGRTAAFPPLPEPLRGADVAVNLHGPGPQSTAVLRAAAPRRLIAFGAPGCPRWRDDEHEVARWCRLVRAGGVPCDPADLRIDPEPADLGVGPPVVVLHPGAASPARRWPADRWAAVARHATAEGYRVVVTGSGDERPLAEEVAAGGGVPPGAVLAGRTSLRDLLAVVAAASRVICADTGVAHVATAVGTPSVVLFGPTSPARWGPPAHDPRHHVLWAGRTGDPHADEPDRGLLDITVAEVVAALGRLVPA